MHSITESSSASTTPRRWSRLALGLLLAGGLYANSVSAQFLTHDADNDEGNFFKTLEQYGKEIAQYKAVLEHYQQQLVSLQHMNFSLPSLQTAYTEVSAGDASAQAEQSCPSPDGNSGPVAGLLQMVTPDLGQSILKQQVSYCQQVVLHRINKYNLTVRMMNRLQGTYSSNLQSIYSQFTEGGTGQGAMDGSKANAQANATALDTEMRQWQGQIGSEDQLIAYDQLQIETLSKKAMNGNNTILGNVVQMVALKAAFSTVGQ